jgi:creatine kinase/arginine kinase
MAMFPEFTSACTSALKQHLTPELFERLKGLRTGSGFSLQDAIRSGVVNQDSSIGVYAGDAETYQLFAELFNPIIADYHGFKPGDQHSKLKPQTLTLANPDPEGRFVLSTRIRVGRNLDGFPLGPALSRAQRRDIEARIRAALERLPAELVGRYFPLAGMSEGERRQLIADHFLFKADDRFLEAAGLNRDWPEGRGIYYNAAKNFLVWVNEEDQLRIISMQPGADLSAVFNRLLLTLEALERQLQFLQDDRLGYLTSCPTNLGTALRASVHIRLPYLAELREDFTWLAEQYQLQIRGIHGEHSAADGGVYDISNRRRLGVTEAACIKDLHAGIRALINAEKTLSGD